jgi:hypothetical protein
MSSKADVKPSRRATALVLALLAGFALLNVGYSLFSQLTKADAGYDFHAYWYYGHYIRQGRDMYYPFLHNPEMLDLPVRYLDGVVVESYPVRQTNIAMAMAPVYTAPMLFFFSLFSWFSWRPAESLWYVCNLAFMFGALFLLMRLLPREQRLQPEHEWLVALIGFGLFSTRLTLEVGQTGFFVLVLMFATFMLMDRAWPTAGLLLGLALSKYSLALPALILLVLMRKYRVAATALLVQALGFVAISLLAGGSMQLSTEAQWVMFLAHGQQDGINLTARLLAGNPLAVPALIGLTALVLGLLGNWLWRSGWFSAPHSSFTLEALQVFNVLTLLAMLVAYHRIYDVVLIIGFVWQMVQVLTHARSARLTQRARRLLLVFFLALLFTLMVVANIPEVVWVRLSPEIPAQRWLDALQGLVSLMLVYALFVSLWLLYRVYPPTIVRGVSQDHS